METALLIIVAFAIAYIITSTPIGKLFDASSSEETSHQNKNKSNVDNEQLTLPEESTLKRHFLSQLRVDIESSLAPLPTCSTQRRHHEALVLAEIDNRLQG